MSSLSHQQVSSVCNIKSVQENKAATEHPTLRPDYETIVQQWDEHPAFRENSYSMLLEVQTCLVKFMCRWLNTTGYRKRSFTGLN